MRKKPDNSANNVKDGDLPVLQTTYFNLLLVRTKRDQGPSGGGKAIMKEMGTLPYRIQGMSSLDWREILLDSVMSRTSLLFSCSAMVMRKADGSEIHPHPVQLSKEDDPPHPSLDLVQHIQQVPPKHLQPVNLISFDTYSLQKL